jgi:hypothetical protein
MAKSSHEVTEGEGVKGHVSDSNVVRVRLSIMASSKRLESLNLLLVDCM